MAFSRITGLVKHLTVLYVEGDYGTAENDRYLFREGRWHAVHVPELRGKWDPKKKRHYIASVGFEGARTLRVVSKDDPDIVSVLFPDPPVAEGYAEITWKENQELFEKYNVSEKRIIRCAAGDAIGAWKALYNSKLEDFNLENCYYICSGTKPHALGQALRAFSIKRPAVIYYVPERHVPRKIAPRNTAWRFEIQDLSAPDN